MLFIVNNDVVYESLGNGPIIAERVSARPDPQDPNELLFILRPRLNPSADATRFNIFRIADLFRETLRDFL